MSEPAIKEKYWFILKTNGVNNIRAINNTLKAEPEIKIYSFWLPGYEVPKKIKKGTTILKKEFLFYDYAFVELEDPYIFEKFMSERKIPAYFLYVPGTKTPATLTAEEIIRVKDLETFKALEVKQFEDCNRHKILVKPGAFLEVVNGPFIGCKGVVLEVNRHHVVLEMNVFSRPTRVNVDINFLENLLEKYSDEMTTFSEDES